MKRIRQWMVVVLMLCTFGAQAQETEEMVYPQAEEEDIQMPMAAESEV